MVGPNGERFKVRPIEGSLMNASFQFRAEDLGQIKGVVRNASGEVVKDAQIFIGSAFSNRNTKSKKDGSYTIGSVEAGYDLEVVSPGYKKFVQRVVIEAQETTEYDIVLEPDVEGVEQMKGKGNIITSNQSGYTMKVASSHPAYEGKTLWYLLHNSPMIKIADKVTVDDNIIRANPTDGMLKELKLQKRELVLANKDTDKIDEEINNIETELESVENQEYK